MTSDSRTPLQKFLEALAADAAAGRVRELADYLAQFPGDDVSIAREFGAFAGSAHALTAPSRPAGPRGRAGEPGSRIGPYRIVRELGRGGQAIVYLAEDERLHRKVALKIMTGLGPGSESTLQRFRREAEVASQLDHPGICSVHDADVVDGMAYIAMRFIEGETLANLITGEPSSKPTAAESSLIEFDDGPAAASAAGTTTSTSSAARALPDHTAVMRFIEIVEKAARALHVAHEAGIIHRDIKPANVMVTPAGDPVIMDFGLARDDDSDTQTLTRTGELFGTPAYMSPEQITGQRIRLDRRTDVWSLGVTLYECLTGKRPFAAPTREALYQSIIADDVPDPRRLNPVISRDLKVVLETALERNRDRRYQSAQDFADDLRRVRKIEPIRARAAGAMLRLRRWGQRNPALAATLAGLVVTVIVASALLSYGLGAAGKAAVESRLHDLAVADLDRAESERLRLDLARRDRQLQVRIEDLMATLGTMFYGFGGVMDYSDFANDCLDMWHGFGLSLAGPQSAAADSAALTALQARAPDLWRLAAGSLHKSVEMWDLAGRGAAAHPAKPAWAAAYASGTALIAAVGIDPWYAALEEARAKYNANQEDTFGPFLTPEALRGRSAEDLFHLAGRIFAIRGRREDAARVLDESIKRRPDSFLAHYVRGALALAPEQSAGRPSTEAAAVAIHHLRVAVALRPQSAIAYSLLGPSYALHGEIAEGIEMIEKSTELDPKSKLAWYAKAQFYSYTPEVEKTAAACRKVLELDPTFQRARDLLDRVTDEAPAETKPGHQFARASSGVRA